jgi:hypothetical protein
MPFRFKEFEKFLTDFSAFHPVFPDGIKKLSILAFNLRNAYEKQVRFSGVCGKSVRHGTPKTTPHFNGSSGQAALVRQNVLPSWRSEA